MTERKPALEVAVVMRRERITGAMSRWQTWRWVLAEVITQEDGFGDQSRCLFKSENEERWLHPGFKVALFTDDTEGYYLNASTPAPGWFVMWRMEDEATVDAEPIAVPQAVSLSYHDAGRWLDSQETVEQVAAPADVIEWLQAFINEHHVVEVKRRKRPESFKQLTDRFGSPASVSTAKKFGGGHG